MSALLMGPEHTGAPCPGVPCKLLGGGPGGRAGSTCRPQSVSAGSPAPTSLPRAVSSSLCGCTWASPAPTPTLSARPPLLGEGPASAAVGPSDGSF